MKQLPKIVTYERYDREDGYMVEIYDPTREGRESVVTHLWAGSKSHARTVFGNWCVDNGYHYDEDAVQFSFDGYGGVNLLTGAWVRE